MVSHIVSHLAVRATVAKFGPEFQTKMRDKKYQKRDKKYKMWDKKYLTDTLNIVNIPDVAFLI